MFRLSSFDKNLENATSNLRLEADWPSILLICDAIRQNEVTPKQAVMSIRKKMTAPNPHTALYSLMVLESVVKNCGSPIHNEICTKESCEMFTNFIETTPHENVKAKMLELIQTWAFAFRSFDKYQAIKDTMTILKTKGHSFPELKEADAMFTSDTAPDWSDGKVCHRCRVQFTFTQRKHHCRNCGEVFCALCSSKSCPLPKYGLEKEVRVCEGCYTQLHAPTAGGGSSRGATSEGDLPAEYLTSSLAQQSQTPPRKTDQELKEEEELQLALALSQSEAEASKGRLTAPYRSLQKSPIPDASSVPPTTTASVSVNNNNHSISNLQSDDNPSTDPELAKYLNRNYWESRKTIESPASPSAPSPMSSVTSSSLIMPLKSGPDDIEIDEFSNNMKTQVEIFVNRMKSNSSRGRSISTDSSVQTLFLNLTSFHSRLLTYIKEMDDKRMWFEQLQDKLTQVKDSRAALDVLRQEHQDKLRRLAEEHERQRQMQMAQKLEMMRKKKQEYLQYQRQLAIQRIQEQEREMHMRQEQQKALYQMGGGNYPYMSAPVGMGGPQQQGSPLHQMVPSPYGNNYGSFNPGQPQQQQQPIGMAMHPRFGPQQQQQQLPSQMQPPNSGPGMMYNNQTPVNMMNMTPDLQKMLQGMATLSTAGPPPPQIQFMGNPQQQPNLQPPNIQNGAPIKNEIIEQQQQAAMMGSPQNVQTGGMQNIQMQPQQPGRQQYQNNLPPPQQQQSFPPVQMQQPVQQNMLPQQQQQMQQPMLQQQQPQMQHPQQQQIQPIEQHAPTPPAPQNIQKAEETQPENKVTEAELISFD